MKAKKSLFFRHNSFRHVQDKLIADLSLAVADKKNILCHATTGIGKTDAAISVALTHALENDLTVFFLTPKISQHEMALRVVSDLREKYDLDFLAADFIGKRHMCVDPILSSPDIDSSTFYELCERRRRKEECNYHKKATSDKSDATKKFFEKYGHIRSHTWVFDQCKAMDVCAYEMSVKIAAKSKFIIADYFQLLIPKIRDLFLIKTKKKISDSIIIIDEAHNLAPRIREQLSVSLNNLMIKRAQKELKAINYGAVLKNADELFERWAQKELNVQKEVTVEKEDLKEALGDFNDLAIALEDLGFEYMEKTNKAKSAAIPVARFLKEWQKEKEGYMRVLKRKDNFVSLKILCLDPSDSTVVLNDAYSSILMSGTLVPLEMHRDVLGLKPEKTIMKQYPSPFPKENRLNIICTDVSTRYTKRNEEEFRRMAQRISDTITATPGNVGIFFPSYAVLESVFPLVETKRKKLVQKREMSPSAVKETLDAFKALKNEGAVVFGVQGGSLSEGIDYSNGEMKCAVIVGVGLDEMSLDIRGLIDYYQKKFGKGWEYGYLYPGVIKGLQAAGRCIRSEKDRAVIIFMDNRFSWANYAKCLPEDMEFVKIENPIGLINKFWSL